MLTGLHILLSYSCTYECDHCFVYSSPRAGGTFTLGQIRDVLREAGEIDTVTTIFFEGGEPFLYFPLMLESAKVAKSACFDVGVVTNGYFAISEEDAELWLAPLRDLGISNLTISDDVLHNGDEEDAASRRALAAAEKLDIPTETISIEEPSATQVCGVMFRGRAVEKLAPGLPTRNWEEFDECPHENLESPTRLHLDCFGNVQICQGISLGNMWETPLSEIVEKYEVGRHKICAPLARGGPARLAREYGVEHEDAYVDACHLCYHARGALLDRFSQWLAPRQVYGL